MYNGSVKSEFFDMEAFFNENKKVLHALYRDIQSHVPRDDHASDDDYYASLGSIATVCIVNGETSFNGKVQMNDDDMELYEQLYPIVSVDIVIANLVRRGFVTEEGPGKYTTTEKGKVALSKKAQKAKE